MAFTDFSGCHVPFVTPFKDDFSRMRRDCVGWSII